MLNRKVLNDNRCLVVVVLQVAQNKVPCTHIVDVPGYKGRTELIIIWELLVVISEDEEGLDGTQVVILFDLIFQCCKSFIQRVGRYFAHTSSEDIADAHFDNLY